MSHDEQLRGLVMDAVANDYEDAEMILEEVSKWCSEDALPFKPGQRDILAALTHLIDARLVKAYFLSAREPPKEIRLPRAGGMVKIPDGDSETGCYFLLTKEGHEVLDGLPTSPPDESRG
jgi:hypothetical protein